MGLPLDSRRLGIGPSVCCNCSWGGIPMGRCISVLVWALAAVLLVAPGARANNWNETTDGDLSSNRLAPSSLDLTPGSNTVTGTTAAGDLDYLTINVPAGYALSGIDLLAFSSTDDLAFIGIQAGSTFTQPPTGTDVTQLLGWTHFGVPTPPASYFGLIGSGPGAIGFTQPLAAGPYTLWIQQTTAPVVGYTWDFVVTPSAPEPGIAGLALLGLPALLGRVANRFLGRAE